MNRLEKLKQMEDIVVGDVMAPDYVIVTFSVCTDGTKACGWGGWLLEGVFAVTGEKHNSGTGDLALPAVTEQICPNCGKDLFRTLASHRLSRGDPTESSH